MSPREPFGRRYYGILNVEGDGDPEILFAQEEDAKSELTRRQSLPEDHDDHLTNYWNVFPCDVAGAWWNSYDPDSRADDPLSIDEIVAVHKGDL